MTTINTHLLLAGVALLLGACSSSPLDDATYRTWPMPDSQTLPSRSAEAADGPAGTSLDLTEAGPEDYVRIALQRNPAIRAAAQRIERLRARVPQVTSLDDPMLQVDPVGQMAETAAGQVGLMSGLSQKLPFPGKLDTRGRIAEQDAAMAMAELQQTRLQVAAETRRAYWSYYLATRAIETTRRSRELLSQFHQIAQTEYKAGTRSQTDVLRASVELSNLDNELVVLAQRQATTRGMLNQLMDRPVNATLPEPVAATSETEPQRITSQLDALLAQAAGQNPTLRRIHERIEQSRQQRRLARLNRWPDLTVSATYNMVDDEGLSMAANGDDQWWLGFGINLPIWTEKYDAAEREATAGLFEGIADLTTQQNRIAFAVQDAYLKVEAQQQLVELFQGTILPQARQTVEAAGSGYRAGSVDFLTLVDNWRKLLNFELMNHRALTEMQQAVADLELAIGGDLPRETKEPAP
ncbi:MAG: TolC family protein [Phycisphaeraceae bacterium]|nr:TolC family protein [Phycisphaeraceae bacterium]